MIIRYVSNTGKMMENPYYMPLDGILAFIEEPASLAEVLAQYANDGDEDALRWVKRLFRYGPTVSLLSELDKKLRYIRSEAYLSFNYTTARFEWKHGFPSDRTFSDRDSIYAVMVARMINDGSDGRLKQCELESCRKYFTGNAKARYCHDNCGAIVRARKMRKDQKRRQAML